MKSSLPLDVAERLIVPQPDRNADEVLKKKLSLRISKLERDAPSDDPDIEKTRQEELERTRSQLGALNFLDRIQS